MQTSGQTWLPRTVSADREYLTDKSLLLVPCLGARPVPIPSPSDPGALSGWAGLASAGNRLGIVVLKFTECLNLLI